MSAAAAAMFGAVLQRKSGKESAAAAARSAAASERSAKAAEDSVALNAESSTVAGRRTDQEALHKRYQDASTQLGSPGAAIRLAGVYAMARLADDWENERQTCVSVLCSYLRMPWGELEGASAAEESEIRRTILALIGERTKALAEPSWSDLVFDFRGARLPTFYWTASVFRSRPMFQHAQFVGTASIAKCSFEHGVTFALSSIAAHLWLRDLTVSGGFLQFSKASVAKSGRLTVDLTFLGADATANFWGLHCAGNTEVTTRATEHEQGTVRASLLTVGREARMHFELEKPETPQLVTTGHLPGFLIGTWSISKSADIFINDRLGALGKYREVVDDDQPGDEAKGGGE